METFFVMQVKLLLHCNVLPVPVSELAFTAVIRILTRINTSYKFVTHTEYIAGIRFTDIMDIK